MQLEQVRPQAGTLILELEYIFFKPCLLKSLMSLFMNTELLFFSKAYLQVSSTSIPAITGMPAFIKPCVNPPTPQNRSTADIDNPILTSYN